MIQFYFGKINTYGEEEDHPKYIKVGHTSYRVTAQEVDKDFGSLVYTYPSLFHLMVKVMIFAYRASSRESFLELDRIYSDFLKPQDGKIRMSRDTGTDGLFTSADHYPMVIIGCRYSRDGAREVEKNDVDMFARDHPGCVFAGECEPYEVPDNHVDEVFQVAFDVYHKLRKRALELPDPDVISEVGSLSKQKNHARNWFGRKVESLCLIM